LKNILKQILDLADQHIPLIVGAAVSGVVALAGDLHIVISSASATEILTPVITSVIVELDKAAGVAKSAVSAARKPLK
jgi:hypothetical protein